jgi:hypothetical protein
MSAPLPLRDLPPGTLGAIASSAVGAAAASLFENMRFAPVPEPIAGDPPCPDIGQRLARFLVLRAIGRSYDDLARAFNLSYEQVRLLLARHGEPPRLAGAQAADMARALAATPAYAGCTRGTNPTHAAHTHAALETNPESP